MWSPSQCKPRLGMPDWAEGALPHHGRGEGGGLGRLLLAVGAHAEKLNHVGHLPVAALPQHALNAVSKRNVDALHLAGGQVLHRMIGAVVALMERYAQ